jgi:hypothetical protein
VVVSVQERQSMLKVSAATSNYKCFKWPALDQILDKTGAAFALLCPALVETTLFLTSLDKE